MMETLGLIVWGIFCMVLGGFGGYWLADEEWRGREGQAQ